MLDLSNKIAIHGMPAIRRDRESDEARYITGAEIIVDGGISAARP